jgi:hypothetical protein
VNERYFYPVEEMRRNCIRKKLMDERLFSSGEEMGRICTLEEIKLMDESFFSLQ